MGGGGAAVGSVGFVEKQIINEASSGRVAITGDAADDDDNNDDGFGIRVARCGGGGSGMAPATLTRPFDSGARN